jgi:hypothetical protein
MLDEEPRSGLSISGDVRGNSQSQCPNALADVCVRDLPTCACLSILIVALLLRSRTSLISLGAVTILDADCTILYKPKVLP